MTATMYSDYDPIEGEGHADDHSYYPDDYYLDKVPARCLTFGSDEPFEKFTRVDRDSWED